MAETKIDPDKLIVKRKMGQGTGAFGMYVNCVVANKETGKVEVEHRFLLAQHTLSISRRPVGNQRASWKVTAYKDHAEAKVALQAEVGKLPTGRTIINGGAPLLVELAVTDIENIKSGLSPNVRHLGVTTMERLAPIDDATWKVDPKELL